MREQKKDLVPVVIDFSKARNSDGKLNESWILTFGAILRWMMPGLYKGSVLPLKIKGTSGEIKSFADVLGKEKKYLQSWKDNGLDSPATYQNRTKLGTAVSKFERVTGLKWPFKK